MKAVETPDSDLTLTLGGAGEDRNLPAKRIQAFDPELGETPDDAHPAIVTTWRPDEGERKALVNGALIELVVHGSGHPPVSMGVGNPEGEDLEALLSKAHVDRAVGFWYAAIAKRIADTGNMGTPESVVELWHEALEETKDGAAPVNLGERFDEVRESLEDGK